MHLYEKLLLHLTSCMRMQHTCNTQQQVHTWWLHGGCRAYGHSRSLHAFRCAQVLHRHVRMRSTVAIAAVLLRHPQLRLLSLQKGALRNRTALPGGLAAQRVCQVLPTRAIGSSILRASSVRKQKLATASALLHCSCALKRDQSQTCGFSNFRGIPGGIPHSFNSGNFAHSHERMRVRKQRYGSKLNACV